LRNAQDTTDKIFPFQNNLFPINELPLLPDVTMSGAHKVIMKRDRHFPARRIAATAAVNFVPCRFFLELRLENLLNLLLGGGQPRNITRQIFVTSAIQTGFPMLGDRFPNRLDMIARHHRIIMVLKFVDSLFDKPFKVVRRTLTDNGCRSGIATVFAVEAINQERVPTQTDHLRQLFQVFIDGANPLNDPCSFFETFKISGGGLKESAGGRKHGGSTGCRTIKV
jgi:hypothetical protein